MDKKKSVLVLKASKDICGSEMGLIQHQFQLLEIDVVEEVIKSETHLQEIINNCATKNLNFTYVYLCSHGDKNGFSIDYGDVKEDVTWAKFGQIMCESLILNDDTIFLLACCKGGLFQVATDILSVCNKINFVCGVKWTVHNWDLTTGFVVFIYNLETKNAQPSYAAEKASLATDYTFACYDRDEVEMNPQYLQRRADLFHEIGWTDANGNWTEPDETVIENVGHQIVSNLIKQ
jgi:hypothetical protein